MLLIKFYNPSPYIYCELSQRKTINLCFRYFWICRSSQFWRFGGSNQVLGPAAVGRKFILEGFHYFQLPFISTNNRSFTDRYNIITKSSIILWTYDQQFEVSSFNYDLSVRCASFYRTELIPSNFLPNIFTFTGHIKGEFVKVQFTYNALSWKHEYHQLTSAVACWFIQVYRKQILLCYQRLIPIFPLINKCRRHLPFCRTQIFHEYLKQCVAVNCAKDLVAENLRCSNTPNCNVRQALSCKMFTSWLALTLDIKTPPHLMPWVLCVIFLTYP